MNIRKNLLMMLLLVGGSVSLDMLHAQEAPRKFDLQAISPQFWKLIGHDAKLVTVASGFGFTEGPVWDPAGFLFVSDETINKIFRVYPDGRKESLIELGDPDGNTFDAHGQLIDCASFLRAIIRVSTDGKYTILTNRYQGMKFNSPNDVTMGPDGAFYFTDPALDVPPGEKQEMTFQGVYRLDDKGGVELLTKELTQPNGLAFSPDGKKLYIDDSEQRNIRVYDFVQGKLANGRIFGTEPGGKTRWRSGWYESRSQWKYFRHRAEGNLGVGSARTSSWDDCDAGAAGQPDLGREGLRDAIHHRYDFRLSFADFDYRISFLLAGGALNVRRLVPARILQSV